MDSTGASGALSQHPPRCQHTVGTVASTPPTENSRGPAKPRIVHNGLGAVRAVIDTTEHNDPNAETAVHTPRPPPRTVFNRHNVDPSTDELPTTTGASRAPSRRYLVTRGHVATPPAQRTSHPCPPHAEQEPCQRPGVSDVANPPEPREPTGTTRFNLLLGAGQLRVRSANRESTFVGRLSRAANR